MFRSCASKNHQKPPKTSGWALGSSLFFRSGPLAAECARCGSQSFLAAHGSTVASGFLLKKRTVSQKKLVVFRGLQSYQSLSLVICWMVELGSLGTGLNSIQKKQTLLVDSSVEPSGRWDQLCSWRLFMLRKGAETAESIPFWHMFTTCCIFVCVHFPHFNLGPISEPHTFGTSNRPCCFHTSLKA